jgi:sialate O-acetylesterase
MGCDLKCLARLGCAVLFSAISAQARVRLPALFADNMVLQQEKLDPIWGWADEGEKVTVEFRGHTVSTEAHNGKWKILLPKSKAGGPFTLTVKGENEITLNNVLVGEVWICSGQSNMEFALRGSFEAGKDIASSADANLHLFTVSKLMADEPAEDVKGKWVESGPETVPYFSAVAYYFGRDLRKKLNVPIGLIHTSWGGSPAEVWMRKEVLEENPMYRAQIVDSYKNELKNAEGAIAQWETERQQAEKEGKPFKRGKPGPFWKPSQLYNGMIAPLIPYAIAGTIWYQGESNAGRAWQYRMLFADMITNWRLDFGQGDFPFLLVQIAPWDKNRKRELSEITKEPVESDWAELREAQLLSTQILPNVGMAVITDLGDKDNIHPTKKEPVGHRLALAAEGIAYGQDLTWSGPVYKQLEIDGNQAIVTFGSAGQGLEAVGGDLKGFAVAGRDRKFHWAHASIEGSKVILTCDEVPHPIAVRYGWADFPVVNLFNKAGLPASPFRTDNFPMLTGPKKF